jgi:hypothetical protein
MAKATARERLYLTHSVTKSPHRPVEGKKTKTDRAPMSTSEYSTHMRRIK